MLSVLAPNWCGGGRTASTGHQGAPHELRTPVLRLCNCPGQVAASLSPLPPSLPLYLSLCCVSLETLARFCFSMKHFAHRFFHTCCYHVSPQLDRHVSTQMGRHVLTQTGRNVSPHITTNVTQRFDWSHHSRFDPAAGRLRSTSTHRYRCTRGQQCMCEWCVVCM